MDIATLLFLCLPYFCRFRPALLTRESWGYRMEAIIVFRFRFFLRRCAFHTNVRLMLMRATYARWNWTGAGPETIFFWTESIISSFGSKLWKYRLREYIDSDGMTLIKETTPINLHSARISSARRIRTSGGYIKGYVSIFYPPINFAEFIRKKTITRIFG